MLNRKLSFIAAVLAWSTWAADMPSFVIEMSGEGIKPAELTLPQDTKVKLVVKNIDTNKKVEFESYELNREEIIKAQTSKEIFVGPLKAGNYEFFDDLNTAHKGVIVVK